VQSLPSKLLTMCLVLAPALNTSPAIAADLPDCKLDQGNFPGRALRDFKMKPQARYFMEVEGVLRNGVENVYERDDAVINVDMRVVRTVLALTPSVDVKLKNSWALSPNFGFSKGQPLRIWDLAELPDGRTFGVLSLKGGSVLFFDEANRFCSKAVNSTTDGQVWQAGTLSMETEGATFDRSLVDDVIKSGSLRIIYLGAAAGAMKFQEVWVQGSRIGKSITRTFDQFAKSIEIAGYKFEVVEVKGDKLKLRYDIASRTEVTATQAGQIALQNSRD